MNKWTAFFTISFLSTLVTLYLADFYSISWSKVNIFKQITSTHVPTPSPTSESVPTPPPTSEPVSTPSPTSEPVSTPSPTSEPVSTPSPTSEPVPRQTILEQRRRHVENYCRKYSDIEPKHDFPILKQKVVSFLLFNKIANLLLCVPGKAGSTLTTNAIYQETVKQLKHLIPADCNTAFTIDKVRGKIETCINKMINVHLNVSLFDEASQLTDAKFMFFRHPMSRLISSFYHGQAVGVVFILIFNPTPSNLL